MEKFYFINQIKNKIDSKKWIEFIESNNDKYIWWENTDDGKAAYSLPSNKTPLKVKVLSDYNKKKGYYEFIINYSPSLGVITVTSTPDITIRRLEMLLEMSRFLGAYLLIRGNKIITREWIAKEKNRIENSEK